jgi:hypothetical protein
VRQKVTTHFLIARFSARVLTEAPQLKTTRASNIKLNENRPVGAELKYADGQTGREAGGSQKSPFAILTKAPKNPQGFLCFVDCASLHNFVK